MDVLDDLHTEAGAASWFRKHTEGRDYIRLHQIPVPRIPMPGMGPDDLDMAAVQAAGEKVSDCTA